MSSTTGIFGSFVLVRREGVQAVLRDHWVVLEGRRIAAVTPSRPAHADRLYDRPGRFVLPGLMNLHNHCFSEAVARTHTEDGAGRKNNQSIVYTVLLPLTKRGIEILSPAERLAVARLGILQLLKGGATTVMEPFRNGIPEMFDAALEMGIRFYGAPYLFSTANAQADAKGVVRYASESSRGEDGAADLAAWDRLHATWEGRDERTNPIGHEPARDGHLRTRPAARRGSASPRTGRADHDPSGAEQIGGRDHSGPLFGLERRRNIWTGSAC